MTDARGGSTRSGVSGSFSYTVIAGREDRPVNFVSFWDAARFANWLHNGQPTGAQDNMTTEDGGYTLTPTDIANNTVTRNPVSGVFVASEDEWYKAAYYNAPGYFDYPTSSDTQTTCAVPGATANTANCFSAVAQLTDVGSYTGAASPYGTFDQGGNAWEWNEAISGDRRGLRGAGFRLHASLLAGSIRGLTFPTSEHDGLGFRVASRRFHLILPALSPLGLAMLGSLLLSTGLLMGIASRRRLSS